MTGSRGAPPQHRLVGVLERARSAGHLGPGPVSDHIAHAERYRPVLGGDRRAVDLGAGGGVPGLVLAVQGSAHWLLVEARARRAAFLDWAVEELGLQGRVRVVRGRAEDVARGGHRGTADTVVARSFGPPAVTAECAVGFLRPGGCVAVSDPPGGARTQRWPATGLARLGLVRECGGPAGVSVLRLEGPCSPEWPRRVGHPAKRPLF